MINVAANDLEFFEFAAYVPDSIMSLLYNVFAICGCIYFFGHTAAFILGVSIFTLIFAYLMAQLPKRMRRSLG
jgi:hypothetical protein